MPINIKFTVTKKREFLVSLTVEEVQALRERIVQADGLGERDPLPTYRILEELGEQGKLPFDPGEYDEVYYDPMQVWLSDVIRELERIYQEEQEKQR